MTAIPVTAAYPRSLAIDLIYPVVGRRLKAMIHDDSRYHIGKRESTNQAKVYQYKPSKT